MGVVSSSWVQILPDLGGIIALIGWPIVAGIWLHRSGHLVVVGAKPRPVSHGLLEEAVRQSEQAILVMDAEGVIT